MLTLEKTAITGTLASKEQEAEVQAEKPKLAISTILGWKVVPLSANVLEVIEICSDFVADSLDVQGSNTRLKEGGLEQLLSLIRLLKPEARSKELDKIESRLGSLPKECCLIETSLADLLLKSFASLWENSLIRFGKKKGKQEAAQTFTKEVMFNGERVTLSTICGEAERNIRNMFSDKKNEGYFIFSHEAELLVSYYECLCDLDTNFKEISVISAILALKTKIARSKELESQKKIFISLNQKLKLCLTFSAFFEYAFPRSFSSGGRKIAKAKKS